MGGLVYGAGFSRSDLRPCQCWALRGPALPPPGTGIIQPVIPGRRTGSELEDIKRIFEEQSRFCSQ